MKILKRYFLIVTVFISISACDKKTEVIKEPLKMTVYLDTIIQDWEGQKEFIKEYNRLTNINLEIIQPPHQQYMDKLIMSFSGENPPDICEILPEYLSFFITQDYVRPLNNYINDSTYIKNFSSQFLNNYRTSNGDIYGFPTRDGGGCVTYIRKDWLENLNLEIPKTWDEFYNVLYQFTYNDPDKNGLDDTKGYTDVNASSQDWYNRAIMLDARVEIYYKNDKWVDGFTEPKMIDALKRLKKIYQEDLTDPNITNNTTFTARNRFINGDVGVITYWANHWARNLKERTVAISGDLAEIVAIPPLEGSFYIKRVAPLLILTKNSKHPDKAFYNFIDRQYDRSSIQSLFTYGVKDYHWEILDGKYTFKINKNDPYTVPFTKAFVPPVAILNDWNQPMSIDNVITPALNIINNHSIQDRLKIGGTYYSKYYIEIEQDIKPDIISKIINNEVTIEQGMDLYKKRTSALYIEKIMDELNH